VLDAAGRSLAASHFAAPAIWPADLRGTTVHRFEAGPLVGLSLPVRRDGRALWVVVTQDQSRPGAVVDDVVRKFLATYWVVLVGLLALMPLVNGIILWGSLRGCAAPRTRRPRSIRACPARALTNRACPPRRACWSMPPTI
jgi:hypothetical protein